MRNRVKKVLKLIGMVAVGIATGFVLWKVLGNVPIVLWTTILGIVPTLIGIEMTFMPPTTPKAKSIYRIIFGGWAIATCVLAYLQYKEGKPQIPNRPEMTLETFSGLPEGMPNDPHLRLHRLLIRNANSLPLENFCSRLQLPEPIIATIEINKLPGTEINWRPLTTKVTINGTGNRSEIGPSSSVNYVYSPPCFFPAGNKAQLTGFFDGSDKTGVWELTIDKLPPHGVASLMFLTSNDDDATNYTTFVKTAFTNSGATIITTTQGTTNGSVIIHNLTIAMIVQTNKVPNPKEDWRLGTNELRFFFEGQYHYQAAGKPEAQHFLLPLKFDEENRRLSSLASQPNDGKWKRVMIEFQ
jgi:hypothetical protein